MRRRDAERRGFALGGKSGDVPGLDRIHVPMATADDAHMMTSTLGPASTEQLALSAKGCPDPELAPPRGKTVMRMRTRITTDKYLIDSDAVADALIERVFAIEPTRPLRTHAA